MKYHWLKKLEESNNISNKKINYIYNEALKNGARGENSLEQEVVDF